MHAIADIIGNNTFARRVSRPLVALAMLFALASAAHGDSVPNSVDLPSLARRADELFTAAKFEEALVAFDEIASHYGDKIPAELAYNRARTLLALQRVGESESLLKSVMSHASDPAVRAAAASNLGMIEADRAAAPAEGTPFEQTLDTLRRSERYFRIANTAHPGDGSAAANVDLIQRRIAAVREEQREQEEQNGKDAQKNDQKSPNEKNDQEQNSPSNDQAGSKDDQQGKPEGQQNSLANELSDLANKQQEEADQSKDLSKQSPQSGDEQSKNAQQSKLNDAAKDQQDLRDRTSKAKQQADAKAAAQGDKSQPSPDLQKAQQKIDEAQKSQQEAEQALKEGRPEQAQQSQQKAADALREAAEHARAGEPSQEPQPSQDQPQQQPQTANRPFDATAAQILDRERALRDRLRQLQMQRSRMIPVEKDW